MHLPDNKKLCTAFLGFVGLWALTIVIVWNFNQASDLFVMLGVGLLFVAFVTIRMYFNFIRRIFSE